MNHINKFFRKFPRIILSTSIVFAAISISGCQSPQQQSQAEVPKTEQLIGVVVSVDKAKGIISVDHEAIPGKMEAMVMPFSPADPAVLSQLKKGDKISADFSVQANGAILDNIKVLSKTTK